LFEEETAADSFLRITRRAKQHGTVAATVATTVVAVTTAAEVVVATTAAEVVVATTAAEAAVATVLSVRLAAATRCQLHRIHLRPRACRLPTPRLRSLCRRRAQAAAEALAQAAGAIPALALAATLALVVETN
jgi:hypothetical protein